ncbi:uncharacterized protein LOC113294495 [Papaver somniferum]|uniref:uncharacterized protein LOC113294495 n=1 Tax=Papaver somniferum TaxID=3469 RepID=UPI000E6FF68A|nr:uncharacterized protein LOC113294495 [Papaver somniferum]
MAKSLTQKYSNPNSLFVSSIGFYGGLVLLWKDRFTCDIACRDNMIHLIISSNASKQEWLLSCVYGSTHYEMKKQQLDFLKDLGDNVFQSWVVIGDLNVHLSRLDTSTSRNSLDIISVGLMDMGYSGIHHTWSNRNNGKGYKRARIDMALQNSNWIRDYPDSKVIHLPFLGSDHCPLLLITESNVIKPGNVWKFYKCWLRDPNCSELISDTWDSSLGNENITQNLSKSRRNLSKWNREHFGRINFHLRQLQQNLSDLQA